MQDVRLSWPGPQRIEGLAIAGSGGDRLAVDLDVDAGLWGLVRGTAPLKVTVRGALSTRYGDDGTLSILDALTAPEEPTRDRASDTRRAASDESKPFTVPDALRGATLKVESFDIDARPTGTGPAIAVDGLSATLSVTDGGADCALDAKTRLGDAQGRISVRASARRLWNAVTGGVDPWSSSVSMQVQGEAIPVPAAGMPIEARTLQLSIESAELGREVAVRGSTQLVLPGGAEGGASADLKVFPARVAGATAASASGTVQLHDVPTSIAAPYLAGTPIDIARDIGPSCDASVTFADRSGQVQLRTARISVSGSLATDERMETFTVSGLTLSTTADPGLAKSLGAAIDAPVSVEASVSSATLPVGRLAEGDLRGLQVDASASLSAVRLQGGKDASAPAVSLSPTQVSIRTKDLAGGAEVSLQGGAFGAPVSAALALAGIADADGRLRADSMRIKGTVKAGPAALAQVPWVSESQRAQLAQAGIDSAAAEAQIDAASPAGTAVVRLVAGAAGAPPSVNAGVKVGWSPEAITLADTTVAATIARTALAPWIGSDIALAEDASLTIALDAVSLARRPATKDAEAGIALPASVRVQARAERLAVAKAPGLRGPISLRGVNAAAVIALDPQDSGVAGVQAELAAGVVPGLAAGARDAATLKATFSGPPDAANFRASADLALAEGSALAACVDAGVAGALLEGPGTVSARMERASGTDSVTAQVRLPRAAADADLAISADAIVVRPSKASIELPTPLLEAALGLREAPDLGATLADARAPRLRTVVDVQSVRWTGKADEAAVVLAATVGPGTLSPPGRPPVALDGLELSVTSPKLASSAKLSVSGRAGVGGAQSSPFAISADLSGDLRALLAPDQPLALASSSASLEMPGSLAIALADWWRGSSAGTDAVTQADRIAVSASIASLRAASLRRLGDATLDATARVDRIRLVPRGLPAVAVGPVDLRMSSPRLADRVSLEASGDAAVADPGADAALRTTGKVSVAVAAMGLVGPDGAIAVDRAQLSGSVKVTGFPTAIVDTLAGAKGDLVDAVGPALTMELDARTVASEQEARATELSLNFSSSLVQVQVPRMVLSDGLLLVRQSQPIEGTVAISRSLKDRVLEQINPVFSDIVSAPPVRWRLSSAQLPLDLDMRRLDAALQVDVGEVRFRRSGQFLSKFVASEGSPDGIVPGLIEPLRVDVASGRLTYRDFKLRVGRFANDWQLKLSLAGDVDLTRKPPYVNDISFEVPLQSIARTAGGYQKISDLSKDVTKLIQALPIDPGELVIVGIRYYGPLEDADGKPVPLQEEYTTRIDDAALKKINLGDVVDTIKGIGDLFRKKPATQ